jgi:hypothetical protein
MIWGGINSANVIEHIGAQEGLITKTEIEKIQNSLTNYTPSEL